MYPKTFEEFISCAEYKGFVKYSLMKINVPFELREDFTQDVHEYLLRKNIVEKFQPNYVSAPDSKAPLHKIGTVVSFSGYIYQYILFMWWKKVRKYKIDVLSNAYSLCNTVPDDGSYVKGCVLLNNASFNRNYKDIDDINLNILVDQFRDYLIHTVEQKEAQGHVICKRDRNIVDCLNMLLQGYTVREMGNVFGVTASAISVWKYNIQKMAVRFNIKYASA